MQKGREPVSNHFTKKSPNAAELTVFFFQDHGIESDHMFANNVRMRTQRSERRREERARCDAPESSQRNTVIVHAGDKPGKLLDMPSSVSVFSTFGISQVS